MRDCILLLSIIALVGCNNAAEVKDEQPQQQDTVEAKKVASCNFIVNGEEIVRLDSLTIYPTNEHYSPNESTLIDSETYDRYLKNSRYFGEDFKNFAWISAKKTNKENLFLVSYERVGEFKDKDTYAVVFDGSCRVLDMLLIASFRKFNGGSTQKTVTFEADTMYISSIVSTNDTYSENSNDEMSQRSYYYSNEYGAFMLVED